jgi:GNAT superfamily N-acetyltransferase
VKFFKVFHSEEKIMERYHKGKILVVELNGNVIATGTLVGSEIFGVFVHPKFQRHGYGGLLMRKLENRAKEKGL